MSSSLNGNNHPLPEGSFSACVLQVYQDEPGWEKTLAKILGSMHEVIHFSMGEPGKAYVSARISSTLLLKALAKAGKKADVIWMQYGDCSSNLCLPLDNPHHPLYGRYGFGTTPGYGRGDYYHGYGNRPFHGYGPFHGCGSSQGYGGGYNDGYGYGSSHGYGGGYNNAYGGGYNNAYGGNNSYHSGYGRSRRLDNRPCPWPPVNNVECRNRRVVNHESEQEEPMECCTIM